MKMAHYTTLAPMASKMTAAQVSAVERWFAGKSNDAYDCMDNYRVAREGNAAEEDAYDAARDRGCCGSCDEILDTEDGRVKVGFNYGH